MASRSGRKKTTTIFTEEVNVRAPSFFVMQAAAPCWSCKGRSTVVGLALSSGFEMLEYRNAAEKAHAPWLPQEGPGIVCWVEYLAPNVAAQVQQISARYRIDFSVKVKRRYWINHCEHCDAKMGDNYMYNVGKPPFGRLSTNDIASIRFTHVKEPFLARVEHFGIANELLAVTR